MLNQKDLAEPSSPSLLDRIVALEDRLRRLENDNTNAHEALGGLHDALSQTVGQLASFVGYEAKRETR